MVRRVSNLPPPSHPVGVLVVYASIFVGVLVVSATPAKNYLKWWGIHLAINSIVGK